MQNRISRRSAFLLVAAGAGVAEVPAASAALPETSEELIEAHRKRIRTNSELLTKFRLDRAVEPIFQFRA